MAKKDTWISTKEAAKQLGLNPQTLNTYRAYNRKNGSVFGPYYRKENGRVLYSQRAVDAYEKKREAENSITGGTPA